MKKIIILFLMLLVCGCSATYKLDFEDNTLSEKISFKIDRNNQSNKDIEDNFDWNLDALPNGFSYDKNIDYDSKYIYADYTYSYDIDSFSDAVLANSCFSYFKFLEEDGIYYITASGDFKCFEYEYVELDSLTIEFTTNHKVIETNADSVNGKKYTWNISTSNNDELIMIKLSSETKIDIIKEITDNISIEPVFLIVIGIIGTIVAVALIYVSIVNKNNNKI